MDSPSDIDALRAALLIAEARAAQIEAEFALARARNADDAATIAANSTAGAVRDTIKPQTDRWVFDDGHGR